MKQIAYWREPRRPANDLALLTVQRLTAILPSSSQVHFDQGGGQRQADRTVDLARLLTPGERL